MKDAIREILGKTINGVIVKQHPDGNPSSQVFLLFDDDTHYEFWTNGPGISGAGGVDPGGKDKVLSFGREGCEVFFEAHLEEDATQEPQAETLVE
jgi:hypothetical protein